VRSQALPRVAVDVTDVAVPDLDAAPSWCAASWARRRRPSSLRHGWRGSRPYWSRRLRSQRARARRWRSAGPSRREGSNVLGVEPQRQHWAMVGCTASVLNKLGWELGTQEDRITRLVERNPFGEQVGAHPLSDAVDRVHAKSHTRPSLAARRCEPRRPGVPVAGRSVARRSRAAGEEAATRRAHSSLGSLASLASRHGPSCQGAGDTARAFVDVQPREQDDGAARVAHPGLDACAC